MVISTEFITHEFKSLGVRPSFSNWVNIPFICLSLSIIYLFVDGISVFFPTIDLSENRKSKLMINGETKNAYIFAWLGKIYHTIIHRPYGHNWAITEITHDSVKSVWSFLGSSTHVMHIWVGNLSDLRGMWLYQVSGLSSRGQVNCHTMLVMTDLSETTAITPWPQVMYQSIIELCIKNPLK